MPTIVRALHRCWQCKPICCPFIIPLEVKTVLRVIDMACRRSRNGWSWWVLRFFGGFPRVQFLSN